MNFIRIDETILPIDNIAYIRADKTDASDHKLIVATRNGATLFFSKEDPDAVIDILCDKLCYRRAE